MINVHSRNIAIAGPIDSGKTTLTDLLYFLSKDDKRTERADVDIGGTKTDIGKVEVERGITIHSVPIQGSYDIDGIERSLTIVDTPGHPEFNYQVETILDSVEGALLLVDMNKGFNNYLSDLITQVRLAELPFMVVLNKVDLLDYKKYKASMDDIVEKFDMRGVQLQPLQLVPVRSKSRIKSLYDLKGDCIVESDNGHEFPSLSKSYVDSFLEAGDVPAVYSSGRTGLGGKELISYIFGYFNDPSRNVLYEALDDNFTFSGKVINKIPKRDGKKGTVAFRVISGELKRGMRVRNTSKDETYKVSHLYDVHGNQLTKASAGEIILLDGLEKTYCSSGDTLAHHKSEIVFPAPEIKKPVISTEIVSQDTRRLVEVLRDLTKWDPSWSYEPSERGIMASSSGSFHLGIMLDILEKEFGLNVESRPFMPRYVAVPVNKQERYKKFIGQSFSKDESYKVVLNIEPHQNDQIDISQASNSFSTENQKLRGLVKYLENQFSNMRWHGYFPLVGFDLKIVNGTSMTKRDSPSVRYSALMNAVNKILYYSDMMALYEPEIRIDGLSFSKKDVDRIESIAFSLRIPFKSSTADKDMLKDDYEHEEELSTIETITKSFYDVGAISAEDIRYPELTLPVERYLELETTLKRVLKNMVYIIEPTGNYVQVPKDKAKQVILDCINGESMRERSEVMGNQRSQYVNKKMLERPDPLHSSRLGDNGSSMKKTEMKRLNPDLDGWKGFGVYKL